MGSEEVDTEITSSHKFDPWVPRSPEAPDVLNQLS